MAVDVSECLKTREFRQQLFDSIGACVQRRLFDPFSEQDLPVLLESRRDRILAASQSENFVLEVQDFLNQPGVNPIKFFHQSAATVPFRSAAWATLHPAGRQWMFQDVHLDGPAYNAGIQSGDILLAVNQALPQRLSCSGSRSVMANGSSSVICFRLQLVRDCSPELPGRS